MGDKKVIFNRLLVLICIAILISFIFVYKLIDYQIINGADYLSQASTTTIITTPITAARGNIVDRNGKEIATNIIGYNVQLNALFLPKENLNETIVKLIKILEANGEVFIDTMPITKQAPYVYLDESEQDVAKIKELFDLAEYSTAEDVLKKMAVQYDLDTVPEEYRRSVAGIRYEMQVREYSTITPYIFATDVSIKTVNTIKELSMEIPGIDIVEEAIRHYPDGTVMPHIIGTIGPIYKEEWDILKEDEYNPYQMNDIIGKSGLEKAYEEELRGIDGEMQVTRAKDGTILSTTTTKEPVPGKTLVLTIDKDFQLATQTIVEEQVKYIENKDLTRDNEGLGDEGATIVVTDMEGGILASATYPSYDTNLYSSNYQEYATQENQPLFNRAISGLYRPGSSFKPVVALAGMLTGEIDATSTVNCTGSYYYWADVGFTPGCLGHHGEINVAEALRRSCNIFFYDVGRRIGYDAINEVARSLGMGVETGIELNEPTGRLSSPDTRQSIIDGQLANGLTAPNLSETWQEGDIAQMSIGQLDTEVSALQLATVAASIANDGVRFGTHYVQSIESHDYDPTKSEDFPPQIVSTLPNEGGAFDTVESGMIQAGLFFDTIPNSPYTIAAKTGSPQVSTTKFNSTIMAYGPVEDPEIAVSIIVENSTHSPWLGFGVTSIFDAYYSNKGQSLLPTYYNEILP